ncbi:MAG: hypothetical protein LPL00_12955 [Alphaproteobacteria bacterium]|nr:hypothetical protein [Alphaproteobacteria bacterium]MDX5370744.1 hypothetical protein [Alphaproteobacteria bacterium]MDX5465158.1 hypothetical protein [Alphaproteobacteria bacterium]
MRGYCRRAAALLACVAGLLLGVPAPAALAQQAAPGDGAASDSSAALTPVAAVPFVAAAPLAIPPVSGMPPEQGEALAARLRAQASAMGLRIADGASPAGADGFTLEGTAAAARGTEEATVLVLWGLFRNDGAPVESFTTELSLPDAHGADAEGGANVAWDGVTGRVLDVIAQNVAEVLDGLAVGTRLAANAPVPRPNPVRGQGPAVELSALKEQTGPAPILLGPVTGAPGDGNISLREAMQETLKKRGIPLVSGEVKRWYAVSARVAARDAGGDSQSIEIVWKVEDPLGLEVGVVRQENTLPRSSIVPAWGDVAGFAADAAADGIVSLLEQVGETY